MSETSKSPHPTPTLAEEVEMHRKELIMENIRAADRLKRAKETIQKAWNLIDDGAEIRAKNVLAKALDEWEQR